MTENVWKSVSRVGNEIVMKEKLIDAIKQWNESDEADYHKLIFAWELKEKHRSKILEGFGKHVPY